MASQGAPVAKCQFRSRPDVAAPRLNIAIPAAEDADTGYIFIAPYAGNAEPREEEDGLRRSGPYIFKDNGDLVWSGHDVYHKGANNFQAARWQGQDVLFSYEDDSGEVGPHGYGHITLVDQHYKPIRSLWAANKRLLDSHEFGIANEKTGFILSFAPVERDLSAWGGASDQKWIVNSVVQGERHSHRSRLVWSLLTSPRTGHCYWRSPL